uniref:Disease resistance protein n=1 Tax=Vitis vinifera TaxID=29760 RepID=F6HCD2_VITVI
MAEAIVSFAVERLGDLLIQQASFLHGVSDKVTEIQAELRTMKCFLRDADARQYESEVIRNWVAEIREAAYDTEDIIETYASKAALRSRRSGLQNNLNNLKRYYACFLSDFKALHEVGTEIDAIKSRISRLTASLQSYNIRSIAEGEGSGFRTESQRLPRRAYSHVVDEDAVGVEDGVEILVEQLMKPDKICSVVSIYGMGGLGKTTLAKKVYHHAHVRRHFDHVAWSSISQYFNVRDVVQGILIQLTSANEEHKKKIRNMRDEELFESVYKIQEEKKCLLILDDMWKIGDWENLKPAFPLHKAGSKILLTTRIQAVASYADPQGFLYQPELLSEEKSWELLRTKAFPRDDKRDPTTINQMELLGKEMAKCCGGLPLAIVVLGGLLATKHHTYEWERVHKHTKSYLRKGKDKYEQQGSGVSDVLALSYQDVPYQLKSCFLYLGHFPADHEIHTKTLVQMWVAEGIVSRVGEETSEDVAEGYLDELIGRCMVQVGRRSSNGRVNTCRLHDLMRDLCLSKAQEENFLEIVNLQQMETFSFSMPTTRTSNKVRRRAIYLDQCGPLESVEEARLPSKNEDEDANSYVNLNPQNVIGRMKWLRHLYLPLELKVDNSKVQWDNLSNLETLKNFDGEQWDVQDLAQLTKLRKLLIKNIKSFKEFVMILNPSCPISNNLESLVLDEVRATMEETDLRQLSICQHLYKLYLGGAISNLPEHHHLPPNLTKLTLWESRLRQDPMPILEKLLNLTTRPVLML